MKQIGERIKKRINKQHFEQQKIAELIGMSASQFSRNLKTGKFKIETLYKLSDILKTPMDYWFKEDEETDILSPINEDKAEYGMSESLILIIRQVNDNSQRIDKLEKQLGKKELSY